MIRSLALCILYMLFGAQAFGATADLDGVDINWVSEGEGKTIVLVHGWTCDMSVWVDQVSELSRDYQVIRLDLPGHGSSGAPENEEFTMMLYADAVETVRRAAGADRVLLVGHSMGALVAGQYALHYPENVAGVVAVDGFLQPPPGPAQKPEPMLLTTEMREQLINGMFVPETPENLREPILEMMLRPSNERAMAVGAAMSTFSSTPDDRIAVPALAIAAEKNFTLDPTRSRRSDIRTDVIPGTGHFLMMEKPLEFNAHLRGFLQEIGF